MPLTAIQRGYWRAIASQDAANSFRNPAAVLRLSGPLNIARLKQAIQTVINRHDALRTRIEHFDLEREPRQLIDPPGPFNLPVTDLSHLAPDEAQRRARYLAQEFLSEEVNLREQSVFAAKLLRLSSSEHVLTLMLDHIVSDAISYSLLANEVTALLTRVAQPNLNALPELNIQFPDYAVWHHSTNEAWRREHAAYWAAKLSHMPAQYIPTSQRLSDRPPKHSDVFHVPLGKKLTDDLRNISRQERCLLPLVILSLYLIVMARWCEQSDLIVSFLSHGRHGHPDLRHMIGCLAHPVFLRIAVFPNDSLRDLVTQVTTEFYASLAHEASRIVTTDITFKDPTEIYFNWLPSNYGIEGAYPSAGNQGNKADADLKIRHFPFGRQAEGGAKFMPYFSDTPSGILAVIWYGGDLLPRAAVERFAAHLRRLAAIFVNDKSTTIRSLDLGS